MRQEPEPVQVIPYGPLPTQYFVTGVRAPDGTAFVQLTLRTPAGEACYFLPVEFAKGLAAHLTRHAIGATGLIIPEVQIPNDLRDRNGESG